MPPISPLPVSRGIIYDGQVLPGSEWCIRDAAAWWEKGRDDLDLRVRQGPAQVMLGHWTAGNPRTGPSAGAAVVRAMKAREREDGTPMSVSIHFVISWDGLLFQTADLKIATIHAGARTNLRSIGVECCWPGTQDQAIRLGVDGIFEKRNVRGRSVRCLRPSDEIIAIWTKLCRYLSSEEVRRVTNGGIAIDRIVNATRVPESGASEHMAVAGTTKVDAAGYLLDALVVDGWRRT